MLFMFQPLSYEMYHTVPRRPTEIDQWKKLMVLPYLFIQYIPL